MNSLQIDTHVGHKTNEDCQLEYPSPHYHHYLFHLLLERGMSLEV